MSGWRERNRMEKKGQTGSFLVFLSGFVFEGSLLDAAKELGDRLKNLTDEGIHS